MIDPRAATALLALLSGFGAPILVRPGTTTAEEQLASNSSQRGDRIASTILDSDELFLSLLAEDELADRLLSVSNFAHDPSLSNNLSAARNVRYTYHRGDSELPLSIGADIVMASPFSDAHARALWKSVSLRVVTLAPATNLEATKENLRQTAAILGDAGRAVPLLEWTAEAQRRISQAAKSLPAKSILLTQAGYVVGEQTLMDEMVRLAGLRNHAATLGVVGHAPLSIEAIVQNPPDVWATIELRADEKKRTFLSAAEKRVLRTMEHQRITLTPSYALSTSPHVLFAAAELFEKVHRKKFTLPEWPHVPAKNEAMTR